eukprot:m.5299 g.5299  ORF g.5299 m.5299 type:complete len:210 (+) comp2498_c0_seq1:39-668(+)
MRELRDSDLRDLSATTMWSALGGFVVGGLVGAREAAERFIRENRNTKFVSQKFAQQDLNHATIKGFFLRGPSWSWRVALFTGSFSLLCLQLERYRGRRDILNFAASGTVVGGAFGVPSGLSGVARGAGGGLVLSLVLGTAMQGLWVLDDIVQERKQSKAREALEAARAAGEVDENDISIKYSLASLLGPHVPASSGTSSASTEQDTPQK